MAIDNDEQLFGGEGNDSFGHAIILDKIFVRIKNNRLLCSTLLKMDGGSQVTMFSMVGILLVVGVVDVYLIKEEYE